MFYRTRVRVLIGAKVITSLRSHAHAPCLSGFFPCVVIRLADTFRARSHFCESYCEFLRDSMGQFISQIRIQNSCSREPFCSCRDYDATASVCPFSQEEIAGSFGLATKNEEDKISSIPSSSLLLQGDWTGCRTGSGEKLSRSQATQGQAIR